MTQGNKKSGTGGKNAVFVTTHHEIGCISADRVVTYAHIVIGFRLQKEHPTRVCITA
jgi:hypothetical protein